MDDASISGGVKRLSQLGGQIDRIADHMRRGGEATLAEDDVKGIGGDKILSEVGRHVSNARGNRRRDHGMSQIGFNQLVELGGELMDAFRGDVESKQLHRDESISIRFVGAKNRPQRSRPNLMKDSKWAERVWRRGAGSFRVQL